MSDRYYIPNEKQCSDGLQSTYHELHVVQIIFRLISWVDARPFVKQTDETSLPFKPMTAGE